MVMNVHYHYRTGAQKKNNNRYYFLAVPLIFVGLIASTNLSKPDHQSSSKQPVITTPVATKLVPVQKTLATPLPWPTYGHSAYGVNKEGVLATSDTSDTPVPIASLAKVITALAILEVKPLKPGDKGPLITITEKDVELYASYLAKNGAVFPVEAGQQISQYDALQAMLMVSANNLSDSLVIWAFGSMDTYKNYANSMVKRNGLTQTNIDDASGFSPLTVSTAREMTTIGMLYMDNPVLKEIAMKQNAEIPGTGLIPNYNSYINNDGAIGIKIGDTDEAKRCFMIADLIGGDDYDGKISVVVVLGAEDILTAMMDGITVLRAGNLGYDTEILNQVP